MPLDGYLDELVNYTKITINNSMVTKCEKWKNSLAFMNDVTHYIMQNSRRILRYPYRYFNSWPLNVYAFG